MNYIVKHYLSTFQKSFPFSLSLSLFSFSLELWQSLFKLVCPFETVLSHIEMYCDFTEVSSQEGSVSCAINHVVCIITKCLEQSHAPQQRQIKQVKSWMNREQNLSACVHCGSESTTLNVTCKDKEFSFCFFPLRLYG